MTEIKHCKSGGNGNLKKSWPGRCALKAYSKRQLFLQTKFQKLPHITFNCLLWEAMTCFHLNLILMALNLK